jgi:hypothetical protein
MGFGLQLKDTSTGSAGELVFELGFWLTVSFFLFVFFLSPTLKGEKKRCFEMGFGLQLKDTSTGSAGQLVFELLLWY